MYYLYYLSDELLVKSLLFMLIFLAVSQILKKTIENRIAVAIIALSTSLMSVLYLSYSQLNFIEMTYNLGGTLIIRHGEGHMGSSKFNQPYKEFPLLTKLID